MAKRKQSAAKKTSTKKTKPKAKVSRKKKSNPVITKFDDPIPPGKPDPRPKPQSCESICNEVDTYLDQKCSDKVNELRKCNRCPIPVENNDWVVINSPFDAALINTGHDGAGGIIASGTGTDLHWEAAVAGSPTDLPSTVPSSSWIPAFVFVDRAWKPSPFGNANWISVFNDSTHRGRVDVFFRHKFYLNSSIDVSQFVLDMEFCADNSVHEIYVNNVAQSVYHSGQLPQSTSPYTYRGFDAGNSAQVALAHDWKSCENEIVVHVRSGSPKIGFLAQNKTQCYEAAIPDLSPEIKITWGDSDCDCLETNDFEVLCLSVCNRYSNVTFSNLKIGRIRIVDVLGNPIPDLPDGTPSVELYPVGPYCFGDIGPCVDDQANGNNCVSREFVIRTRGARDGRYRLFLEGICFEVCHHFAKTDCFELQLCKD